MSDEEMEPETTKQHEEPIFSNVDTGMMSINYDEYDAEGEDKFFEQERLALLWRLFDDKQKTRYEKFKASGLENRKKNRSTHKIECPRTKKVVQTILGDNVQISNQVQIVLHGIAKIYAGELIEEAKTILVHEEGFKDKYPPIKPHHLREARRRMIRRGILPGSKQKHLFGKRQ